MAILERVRKRVKEARIFGQIGTLEGDIEIFANGDVGKFIPLFDITPYYGRLTLIGYSYIAIFVDGKKVDYEEDTLEKSITIEELKKIITGMVARDAWQFHISFKGSMY